MLNVAATSNSEVDVRFSYDSSSSRRKYWRVRVAGQSYSVEEDRERMFHKDEVVQSIVLRMVMHSLDGCDTLDHDWNFNISDTKGEVKKWLENGLDETHRRQGRALMPQMIQTLERKLSRWGPELNVSTPRVFVIKVSAQAQWSRITTPAINRVCSSPRLCLGIEISSA